MRGRCVHPEVQEAVHTSRRGVGSSARAALLNELIKARCRKPKLLQAALAAAAPPAAAPQPPMGSPSPPPPLPSMATCLAIAMCLAISRQAWLIDPRGPDGLSLSRLSQRSSSLPPPHPPPPNPEPRTVTKQPTPAQTTKHPPHHPCCEYSLVAFTVDR
jgi:hypothetical protein